MKSLKSKFLILILLGILAMQWYRPNKNYYQEVTKRDFLQHEKAPKEVADLFRKACYDCHSNQTNYKWFDEIAPISWVVDNNIKNGSFGLNFSHWSELTPLDKEIMFPAIVFDINSGKMPKKNYLRFHPEAQLTEADKAKMTAWIRKIKIRFVGEGNTH